MRLTIANQNEIDIVVDLVNEAYRGVSNHGWTTEAGLIEGHRVDRAAVKRMIDGEQTKILLAKDQTSHQIQGCVAVRPVKNNEWYLSMLAVNPARQTTGIGRSIMTAAETFVGERGGLSIDISVIGIRDSLIAWYERRGYEKTGEIEPFPYDDPSVGVPLLDDLTLITLRKSLPRP
ncbi:GNAT family N-acetyltransferase [Agrobacterium vitis]